jgi:exoribonuclease R
MIKYKTFIEEGNYSKFHFTNAITLKKIDIKIQPASLKLFNHDVFTYENDTVKLLHSSIRSIKTIPGVLVLQSDKMYGKIRDKFLFKCIPDDKRLPPFLIPYKNKNNSFHKLLYNKYITFKYHSWNNDFPRGTIEQVIGNVSELCNFYEYNLYCKSLYASIQQFNKATMKKLRSKSSDIFIEEIQNKYNPEMRHERNIFAIDPVNSKDFDDAVGMEQTEKTTTISIYIANVSFWLDIMDLWNSFSQRISTIYLPDRKRPMLPTILSDALCSLVENQKRFAFTLDLVVDNETLDIISYKFLNTAITLKKNLRYDTKELEKYKPYKSLLKFIKKLNKRHKYVENIVTSHDVVAYLMIFMNYMSAKELVTFKKGIFRSAKYNDTFVAPKHVPKDVQKFLKMWNSFGGRYCKFKDLESHDMLELDAYVHITSPIRRLVDLLTMLELQRCLGLYHFNEHTTIFYDNWTNDESMKYINKTMRSIRKVQNDCSLLDICMKDTEKLNKTYNGFIFDKILRNDNLFQYMIFLPELKMTNRITTRYDLENHSKQLFKIYVFIDENRLKQKIRVEFIHSD